MDWQNGTIFGCEVKVRWEQVVRALAPVSAEEERRTGAMTETVRSIGGKPPRRDWDAFWIEVALYVSANDLFQTERTEVQRHMAEWSAEHMEDPAPDLATVRAKIRKLYDAVERARK